MQKSLLIVDDISVNRAILRSMLKNEYSIYEAENGQQALEQLRSGEPVFSALLLDISMPVMDGFAVLEAMRADDELRLIPAIVTTGQSEAKSEMRALELGASDYVTKPYNSTIIRQRIRNAVNLRENLAEVMILRHDSLTGLYNREAFCARARKLIDVAAPGSYTLASLNIYGFKIINDQYGSQRGDDVLCHVASCIKRFTKSTGGICCRISADNFAAIYPSGTDPALLAAARDEITSPEFMSHRLRIRIGRYKIDDISLSVSAMYDRATIAENSIKGRYDVYFAEYDETMLLSILREQEIINDMNRALDNREFEVWFQPQFNHTTGAIIGSEALVRWRHPEKGLISPGEFIPVFEKNGFIYELDSFVWEEVCRLVRQWLDEGHCSLPVSVNISRYDLFCEDLIDRICSLTAKYSLSPELLRLEITESAFAGAPERIIDTVESLAKLGFTVEIDDFGSGYSSLNTLKDVPAHVLKLDMRFLESGRNSERGGNIIESIVRMAKWLGMPVIAEGVETIRQAEYLSSIGCYYLQGFLYARPMPVRDFQKFVDCYKKEQKLRSLETLDNLNNNSFWNPESMETLIFNSYVGGACIFEYHNGKTELLRINRNYIKELSGGLLTSDEAFRLDIYSLMSEEDRRLLLDNIALAIETGNESDCEICLNGIAGTEPVYLRAAVQKIASTGGLHLMYSSIVNITALRVAEKRERETYDRMRTIMDDIPGGFCQVEVTPDRKARLIYFNDGLCHLAGMTREEISKAYGDDIIAWIRPDCCEKFREDFRHQHAKGKKLNIQCSLRHGVSGYIDAMIFGRIVDNADGGSFVNAYFMKVTSQLKINREQGELLDNLPCLAGIFRTRDGEEIETVYLNRYYSQIMNRKIENYKAIKIDKVIHPDDLAPLSNEIRQAIAEQRDISITLRLLYADTGDKYISFYTSGCCRRGADGVFTIYASFNRISNLEMLKNMLPKVMACVIRATSDLCFVKDTDYRYLCASRDFLNLVGIEKNEDIVGKTDYDLFERSIADKYRANDIKLTNGVSSLVDISNPLPTDDTVPHYAVSSKFMLRDEEGNGVGIYGFGRDVTNTKNAFEQLKLLTESIPGGIASFELTENGLKNVYFNEGFYAFSGYSRDEYTLLTRDNPFALVFKEDYPGFRALIDSIAKRQRSDGEYTMRCHTKDGGYRWLNIKMVLSDETDGLPKINLVQFDISDFKQAEENLRISQEQYRLVMELSGTTLLRYEVADRSIHLSEAMSHLFELPRKLTNVPDAILEMGLVTDATRDTFKAFYDGILSGKRIGTAEIEHLSRDGWLWVKLTHSTVFSDNGNPVYAVVSVENTTEQHKLEREHRELLESRNVLQLIADTDGLTGVLNRHAAEERIREQLDKDDSDGCALIILDIDDLKKINDTLGHPQGDRAIRRTAEILVTILGDSAIVGRAGGDEFFALISGSSDRVRIRELLSSVLGSVLISAVGTCNEMKLSVSIGVALADEKTKDFDTLYGRADKALYYAKRNGKKQFAFYSSYID